MKHISAIALAALVATGCNTLMEAASPNDTTLGYRKETNSSGETVYRRERYVAPRYEPEPTPVPAPVVIVDPQPVYRQDNNLVERRAAPIQLADAPSTSSSPSLENDGTWAFGGELSSDSKRTHFGIDVFKKFDWLEARAGVSLFRADKDMYAGFDAGLRPMIDIFDGLTVFGGIGLYGGDTKRCSYAGNVESCEKRFLYAGFVEGGVYIFKNVSVFARSYNIEEAGKKIPSDTFFGIGLRTAY